MDFLIVIGQYRLDPAGDLRADLHGVGVDEGVVGADPVARIEPPVRATADGTDHEDRDQRDQPPAPSSARPCRGPRGRGRRQAVVRPARFDEALRRFLPLGLSFRLRPG